MKPCPFRYESPTDVAAVHALLSEHGDEAKLLAGGQSLAPLLNLRMARPSVLVDLARVGELAQPPCVVGDSLRLWAMTTYRQVLEHPHVSSSVPLLAEAIPFIGHQAIRNTGTIGGSVAHADPAAELPTCLVALEAGIGVWGAEGQRVVPAGDFFTGTFSTVLEPLELVAWIDVPLAPAGSGAAWLEVAPRHGDYAVVGVAAVVRVEASEPRAAEGQEGGRVAQARVCLSGVADRPAVVASVDALVGELAEQDQLTLVADAAAAELNLHDDLVSSVAYRQHLVRDLTARALRLALRRAEQVGAAP